MGDLQLQKIVLRRLQMGLKAPFSTSFGTIHYRDFFIIEAIDRDGLSGWGESVAFDAPWYSEETVVTNEHVMIDFLIPLLRQGPISHPDDLGERFSAIRRNNMAKAAIEGAIWDLYAKQQGLPLSEALGGSKKQIEVGISLGIQKDVETLLDQIGAALDEGYRRIKIKIKPGWDVDVLRRVREVYPDIPLMADANSAYTLKEMDHLKQLDHFDLLMIEQPLAHDDIIQHARLQRELKTPICLDESIHSFDDAKNAVELGSCQIINIKIGRVGGLTVAKRIHDFCQAHDIPVWCGGMLEAGVGRAHNIAITTLPQFTLPGDTSASARYWDKDIITPEVTVHDGLIQVPKKPGIGYEVDQEALEFYTVDVLSFEL
jgi:O-succinylbenzoate synthase